MTDKLTEKLKVASLKRGHIQQEYEIEYYVVNMKNTLNEDKGKFMEMISKVAQRDLAIMDIPVIQAIINFKWNTYTKKHFVKQFFKTLVFIASLILDLIFISP